MRAIPSGANTALVTPFRDGNLDGAALPALARRQEEAGTAAIVVCGSTGEAPALSIAECARLAAILPAIVAAEERARSRGVRLALVGAR